MLYYTISRKNMYKICFDEFLPCHNHRRLCRVKKMLAMYLKIPHILCTQRAFFLLYTSACATIMRSIYEPRQLWLIGMFRVFTVFGYLPLYTYVSVICPRQSFFTFAPICYLISNIRFHDMGIHVIIEYQLLLAVNLNYLQFRTIRFFFKVIPDRTVSVFSNTSKNGKSN